MDLRYSMNDERLKIANREAWIGLCLAMFNFLWWYLFAYGLGSKDPEEYSYVFGLPAWFFYSCVIGFIVMVIIVTVVVKLWFIEVPLEDKEETE